MPISCSVLDDDPDYCKLIADMVSRHEDLVLSGVHISQGESRKHIARGYVQLLFIDMEMPGLSGIDFVKSLSDPPLVIFITSHPKYALDSYDVDAVDYLVKPVNEFRFSKAVAKAKLIFETRKKAGIADMLLENNIGQDYFMIRSDSEYVKIKFTDVLYFEAMADFVKIHTCSKVHIALSNLKNIENCVPPLIFLRVHRSFIVNLNLVTAISGNIIKMGEVGISIGESYKEAVIKRIVGKRLLRR